VGCGGSHLGLVYVVLGSAHPVCCPAAPDLCFSGVCNACRVTQGALGGGCGRNQGRNGCPASYPAIRRMLALAIWQGNRCRR
jgi:hypothetical protein